MISFFAHLDQCCRANGGGVCICRVDYAGADNDQYKHQHPRLDSRVHGCENYHTRI